MIPRNTPAPHVPDAAVLQWASGHTLARTTLGSGRFTPFIGFHVEAGKEPQLDELLVAAGPDVATPVEIKHQRPGGAEVVRHWSLGPAIHFLPITAGPVARTVAASLANGNARATADAGIGLRWGRGERSKLAVRGVVDRLWNAGYRRPVQLSVRSRMTDVLLAVLLEHTRVAEAADGLVDRVKHPEPVSPAELWLPLVAGDETEFGSGDTATVTPIATSHPAQVTREHLRVVWAGPVLAAEAAAVWPAVKAWAHEYATRDDDLVDGAGEGPAL